MIIRDNFCLFCFEPYVVTPHLNRLVETVQMRGHNIWQLDNFNIISFEQLSHGCQPVYFPV